MKTVFASPQILRVPAFVLSGALAAAGLFAPSAQAAVKTWTGTTDANWATGTNWSGSAVPVTGDSATFTSATGAGGLSLSDNLMTPATFNLAGITFNAGSGAYVINPATSGTNGFTLTGNVTNNSTSLQTINDLIAMTAVRTFTTATGGGNLLLGGVLSGAGGVTTAGSGAVTLSGANTYTGATVVGVGTTLNLDYGTQDNSKLSDTASLTLTGGTLTLNGGTHAETVSATTLNAGAAKINRPTGGATVNLNAITRNTGSAVNFGVASLATTDTLNTNGILGGYATVGGTDWATNSTNGADGAITAYSAYVTGPESGWVATDNVSITDSTSLTANRTINSAKLSTSTTGQSLDVGAGQTLTLSSGGLLFTGANDYAINNGTLKGNTANNSDLVVHQNGTGVLTIGSVIANSTGATQLTKVGSGTLVLTGANTYTGANNINEGTVRLGVSQSGSTGALGAGTGTLNVNTGGTVDLGTFNVTVGNLGGVGTITSTATAGSGGVLTNTGNGNFSTSLTGTMGLLFNRAGAANFGDTLQVQGGTNTFSGGLTITSTVAGAIGSTNFNTTGGLNSTSNLTVRFNSLGLVGTGPITFNNGGIHFTTGGTLANNVVVGANGGMLHADNAGGVTYAGSVSGSGYLALSNGFGGAANFSGSNSAFTGTIGVDTNFIANLGFSGSATGNSSMSVGFFGSSSNGSLRWTGTGSPTIQLGEVFTGSGSTTTAGLLGSTTANTTVTYQIGDNTANTPVLSGTIANGTGNATTSVTAITKVGSNTQTFSGANTYTGATNLNGGTLALGSAGAIGTTGTIGFGGGTLQHSASNTTDYSARFSTSAGQAYSIDTNGQSVTYATALTSSGGSLTKKGSGTLGLSAANTFGGTTRITGGTLALSGAGVLASTALAFDISDLGAGQLSIANTSGFINGASAFTGTLTLNVMSLTQGGSVTLFGGSGFDSGDLAFSGISSDDVSLTWTNNGSGVWSASTLSGNQFSGTFDQNLGTLTYSAVPEPQTCLLIAGGLLFVVVAGRRRHRHARA